MRRRVVRVGIFLVLVAIGLATAVTARATRIASTPAPTGFERVVVFTVPELGLGDVGAPRMPNLARLASRGAIGGANVRTLGRVPNPAEAYTSLGAGNRIDSGSEGAQAYGADEALEGSTAAEVVALRTGRPVTGQVVVPRMPAPMDRTDGGQSEPGALASALHAAGLRTAVVANSDTGTSTRKLRRSAPAALAVATPDGVVDVGSVAPDLLAEDPTAPFGVAVDPDAFVRAVDRALDQAEVVVVDPGETARAAAAASVAEAPGFRAEGNEAVPPTDDGRTRREALARTDAVLGRVAAGLDPDTLLIVVGVTPPERRWAITPVVLVGRGVDHGYLHSPTTHRSALLTLPDVSATILRSLDVARPPAMIGSPLRLRPGPASWTDIRDLDDLLRAREPVDAPMTVTFVVLQAVLYVLAALVLLRDPPPQRIGRVLWFGGLLCGAWPVATFWLRVVPRWYALGYGTFLLSWTLAAALALMASRFRRHRLDPVLFLAGVTMATIVLDLATGARLQYGSFFGYTPNSAPRFTGIGNAGFALLAGSTIAVISSLVARSKDRVTACWAAAGLCVIAVVADGAPWTGADVGGILTLVPVLGLTVWALSGRRIRWRTLLLAGLGAALALALAVGVEALRAPDQRTHVGRFFLNAGDGGLVRSTLERKWVTNMRVLRSSVWAWLVPIIAGSGIYVLVVGKGWRRVLPQGSPERIGVVATLAAGVSGWLLNDSGIMVLAVASIFLGPYVLSMAFGEGEMSAAASTPDEPSGPPVTSDPSTDRRTGDGIVAGHMAEDDPTAPGLPAEPVVVAIVPAKDRADSIADTVAAIAGLGRVQRLLVVDDGSVDDTAAVARRAGADVLRLPQNRGKGGAVLAGVAACPEADVFLLIDADLARTASAADLLLDPVLAGDADLVVGVLPSAEGRAGFGTIKSLAAKGVQRACGMTPRAPLSGQRAVRAHLLRGLTSAERFGLEVAMTVDVVRAGGRVVEVDVPMDHRHTGRSLAGFAHRGRQGVDIVRSLLPRLTSSRQRLAGAVALTVLVSALAMVSGANQTPVTEPLATTPSKVLIFGMEPFGFDDLDLGVTPNLDRLIDEGALGAMSVRTVARRPNAVEGYLSLGAGARLRSAQLAGTVLPADEEVVRGTAADYVASLSGTRPTGDLVALGGPALSRRNLGPEAASPPGSLGEALRRDGLSGAVVANSDQPRTITGQGFLSRPAALAVMGADFGITHGVVDADPLLVDDVEAPFGLRADPKEVVGSALDQLRTSAVVVVDPGDLARAERFGSQALPSARDAQWRSALARTDQMLGQIVDRVDDDTLVLVVSVAPPRGQFRLTPFVAWGPGVPRGTITSPSTQRRGLSALTDVAPTVLEALGVAVPVDLPGNAVRYQAGPVDVGALKAMDQDTVVREATYGTISNLFIRAHWILYALALLVVSRRPRFERGAGALRLAALGLVSFPVASFLVRLVPGLSGWFPEAQAYVAVLIAAAIGLAASRARRHPLAPLAWIYGLTVGVILLDTWIGTRLQTSSWLGYSLHNAGRFYGVPNTTFAVLGSCTLLLAGILVDRSPRPREAVWWVGGLFLLVLVSAGLPMLGADVGTLITLFPIFLLLLVVLSGRRLKIRSLVTAGGAMVALVTAAALVDLARPAEDRSHLGQFAEKLRHDGPSALIDTFTRKQSANFRILGGSTWTDLIPLVLIFLFITLVWDRRARELLPAGSAVRACFVSVFAAAALGFAANDSGPVVVALFLAFLPPMVVLQILGSRSGTPELLPASPADP